MSKKLTAKDLLREVQSIKKQAFGNWWEDSSTNWGKVTQDVVKGLGRGWEGEYFDQQYRIFSINGLKEIVLSSRGKSDGNWMVYAIEYMDESDLEDGDQGQGQTLVNKRDLSGDYSIDIAYIVKTIKRFFKQ